MSNLDSNVLGPREPGGGRRHRYADGEEPEGKGLLPALVALLLVVGVLGALAWGAVTFGSRLLPGAPEDYSGSGSGEVQVEVTHGDTATDIARRLVELDVVASVDAFRDAARADERSVSIQPGFYAVRERMAAAAALDLLLDPASRVETRVTVREGLRLAETFDALSVGTGIPVADFEAAAADPALALPEWTTGNPEGVLFPATYTLGPDAAAADVLSRMVRRFEQASVDTGLDQGAHGLSPGQLLTVASLIEAEAPPEAMSQVARVVYNRLAAGTPLQFDSTVNYVNGTSGITTTAAQRRVDSPYNTYLYPGLPPAPINAPGEAAIRAAINPADGPWLYFVTVNPDTGETRFSTSLEEHNTHVAQFRAWLQHNGSG